jgi:3-phenylpropionate/trans-cinnamate dioxygenase ferredoxin subunit
MSSVPRRAPDAAPDRASGHTPDPAPPGVPDLVPPGVPDGAPPRFVRVAALADVSPGTLLQVEVAGGKVCLANAGGRIYAFADRCSHRAFPLSAGAIHDGDTVECTWHGARFDMATGRATRLPAIKPIRTREVLLSGDDIFVSLDE